jgi:cytochrome c553
VAGDFVLAYSFILIIYFTPIQIMKSAALLTTLLALASVSLPAAADIKAGEKAAQSCVMCHGENGLSRMPGTPSLAGQPEIYLASQLKQFRDGKRHNEVMNVIAKPLSDEDIDNVSAWFAQFEVELKKK